MSNVKEKFGIDRYNDQISEIIQGRLIDLYGINGYRSILKTIMDNSKKNRKQDYLRL